MARVLCIWIIAIDNTGFMEKGQKIFSAIAMQTLIFLAGYAEKDDKTLKETAIGGIKPLLFPYALFQAIFFVYWLFLDLVFHRSIFTLEVRESGSVLRILSRPFLEMLFRIGDLSSPHFSILSFPLWWLLALYLVRIVHKLILMVSMGNRMLHLACVAFSLFLAVMVNTLRAGGAYLPFCIESVFFLLLFFEIGKEVKKLNLLSIGRRSIGEILILLLAGITGIIILSIVINSDGEASLTMLDHGNSHLFYLGLGLVGVFTLIIFSLLYTAQFFLITLLSGGAIIILAFHVILSPYITMLYTVFELEKGLFAAAVLAAFNISVFIIPINTLRKYFPSLASGKDLELGRQ